MESLEGQLLAGKYRVERVLGQGGMGVVVAAMHQQLEQRVALKFLVPGALTNEEAVGRFLREARSAVRLMSEHVARVIDVGTLENGAPYIVMEYLDGRDLATVVGEQGPLPVSEAVEYVLQACEALAEAHAAGIIHRDLKPANLFLTHRRDGTPCVKVLDFGIAKISSKAPDSSLMKTNGAMGTPFYMSPEQMKSARNADARSDIWSLGIILFELLTGDVAFARQTLPALCAAILSDPPPALREKRPDVPARLEAIVLNCLAKEPSDRYQNVAELAAALSEFATEEGRLSVSRVRRILASGAMDLDRTSIGTGVAVRPSDPTQLAVPDEAPVSAGRFVGSRRAIWAWGAAGATIGVLFIAALAFVPAWQSPARVPAAEIVSNTAPTAAIRALEPIVEPSPAAVPVAPAEAPAAVSEPAARVPVTSAPRKPRTTTTAVAPKKPPVSPPSPRTTIPGDFGDRK